MSDSPQFPTNAITPMEPSPSTPQPTEPQQQHPPENHQLPPTTAPATSSSIPPPAAAATSSSSPNPNPQSQQPRPSFNTRPWNQPYSHFSLPSPPLISPSSSSTSPSISAPPASFSSLAPPTYPQQSQIRQPMQGMGMTGVLGTSSSMRPPHRPQSSAISQSPTSQNFQGHSMLRVSSLGPSPVSPSTASQNQPWLSSGTQGKPPLPPSPSIRPQPGPQSFQQRSHIPPQPQHTVSATAPQKQTITSGQQSGPGPQNEQQYNSQQFPPSRIQQQVTRGPGIGIQRPQFTQSGNRTSIEETEESSNRIVSKRSIQELLNQIDPSEKLDPEVEDILVDIAEDFVDSITSFGCSLAKHRKSTTLEAKDILLHLERNCHMTLPGFGGDEMKTYKKPFVSDVHRERLAAIRKSVAATDMINKHPVGSGGNVKGHLAKGPAITIGSPPKAKIRETA